MEKQDDLKNNQLLDDEFVLRLADFFSVFGDSTRMQIVSLLRNGEMNVSDIADMLNLSISAVSHQLKLLRSNNLVRSRRQGKYLYYYLSDEHVTTIFDMGVEHIKER